MNILYSHHYMWSYLPMSINLTVFLCCSVLMLFSVDAVFCRLCVLVAHLGQVHVCEWGAGQDCALLGPPRFHTHHCHTQPYR